MYNISHLTDQSRLQNGEDISRHKDTVIIATTNDNYRGCEELNESVIDRFQLVLTMDLPEKREMVDRVIKRTGIFVSTNILTVLESNRS